MDKSFYQHRFNYFGEWVDAKPLESTDEVRTICQKAEIQKEKMASFPLAQTLTLIDHLGKKWSDPNYPLRLVAMEMLPMVTGYSREMLSLAFNELSTLFQSSLMQKKIHTELRGMARYPRFHHDDQNHRLLQWRPLGVVLHILSGNVFLVGPSSWLEGVLTGNVTLLKLSSGEPLFMPLFLESVAQCEKELNYPPILSQSTATLSYSSSKRDIIEAFQHNVDGLVVWGGDEAVKSYREGLPSNKRMVIFGPKISFALITSQAIESEEKLHQVAQSLTQEITIWDQSACTAPQICYVEGEESAKKLINLLPYYLDRREKEIPQGRVDPEASAEIRKWRSLYEMADIQEAGMLRASSVDLKWTVVLEKKEMALTPSPLYRTLKIIPLENIQELEKITAPVKDYLQTVGLASDVHQFFPLTEKCVQWGALRVMPLGQMFSGAIDDPHDGQYSLPQLLQLVVTHLPKNLHHLTSFELLSYERKREEWFSSLTELWSVTQKSPWYQKRLESLSLHNLSDWEKVPIMTKKDWEKMMPPASMELSTELAPYGGHITRSGGSTGIPKFSWFPDRDWQAMVDVGVEIFKRAGFSSKDRVANCFLSGDLYGSFISFSDVNKGVGMTSFPFAGKVTPENLFEVWSRFHFNVLEGVPSFILPILRETKKRYPDFHFVKFIYGGEPLAKSDREWLLNSLGVELVFSLLGTTEAGAIAYQDSECKEGEYWLAEKAIYAEVVDDLGQKVPDGVKGRLIVTPLFKHSFPLLRYDLGDSATLIPHSFEKGRGQIIYHGRHDDIACIGLMNFCYSDLERILHSLSPSALQMIIRKEEEMDLLTINVEMENPIEATTIKELIIKSMGELEEHIEQGYIAIHVKCFSPGELPRNNRTGKIKRIIDERFY